MREGLKREDFFLLRKISTESRKNVEERGLGQIISQCPHSTFADASSIVDPSSIPDPEIKHTALRLIHSTSRQP
ncbi:hypothetical protein N7519_011100 [Penicillium mononematosum]|uniref:uncharacterized protein n=1 Tax=Penicillium mononematosum TaxID=268346 RepID=UPI0025476C45|nr:uncharacterized protein N7519_011100 [Penicillium mononematosum]KAJ6180639.1 hypothetical protein N7519_011100 [Penicillium mononematosum]